MAKDPVDRLDILKRSFLELHQERQELVNTMGLLLRITETITASGEQEERLERILDILLEDTGFENISILVYHRDTDSLKLLAARGFIDLFDAPFSHPYNKLLEFKRGEGIAWQVFESHVPTFVEDFRGYSRAANQSSVVEIGCLASLPLLNMGVINFSRSEPCEFSAQRKRDLVIVARVVAALLHSSDVGERLEESHRQIQQFMDLASMESGEEMFNRIVNTVPQGICFLDSDKRIADVNRGFLELFGCNKEDVIGRSPLLFFEDGADFLWLENSLKKSRMAKLVDISLKRLDGSMFPADLFLHTLSIGDDGGASSYMLVIHDLTGQKLKAESILRSEKLKALGAMAGGIAHDFNNVLTSIQGNIEILKTSLDDPSLLKRLEAMETAVADGAYTVRRLQVFRGKEEGSGSEGHSTSLLEAVVDAVELTRPRWKDAMEKQGKKVEIEIDCDRHLRASIHPSAMREVLVNLVFNAVDAMPDGGTICFRCGAQGEMVVLAVEDTGVGMEDGVLDRIFDPFYTTKGLDNSGLGLSMCYSLVTRAGGDIEVDSAPGEGTTFTIRLPAAEEEAGDEEEDSDLLRRPLSILTVDDDPQIAELLHDMLKAQGHDVVLAEDGEHAVELMEKHHFDVVLTDLGMPGMNGWEVARRIKEISASTPVLLLTGWGADYEGRDLAEKGVDGVLCKPFKSRELLGAIAQVVTKGK